MKKNFFKKLSFVLALAMIVSVLAPAAGVFAATTPKLNAKTAYLHLDVADKNEFDFNIANKKTGWKYLWSSANENVAEVNAKNGVVTATGAGSTKVSVVITDKDGEEVDELTATVYVRDNIKSLTITNTPAGDKLAVGVENDFNRSYTTVAGSSKKTSGITRWSVDKEGATIAATNGKFVATAAGTYTVTARAFQSNAKYTSWLSDNAKYASYVTATATYKVTVAASMSGVKQTGLATADVTFNSAMTADDVKNISVYAVIGTAKVKQLVKEVKLDDAKKVATVTMYVNFTPETTYVVDYPNMESVKFVAVTTKWEDVKSMTIATTTAVLNTSKEIEVKLFNKDGVNISTDDLKARVTMTSTGDTNTSFNTSNKTLYMYLKGATTTIKAVFHTYKYNLTNGTEEGNIEASQLVTCVEADATNVTGVNAWTIKNTGDTPNFGDVTHTVAAGDNGKRLFVKLDTLTGTTKATVNSKDNSADFEFTSSDQSVIIIDNQGNLTLNKEGTAVVVVKYAKTGTKVAVGTVEIQVGAKRAASQFSLSTYEFTLSNGNANGFVDSKDVSITLKDQLNADFAYTTYDVERLSGPKDANGAITELTPVGSGIAKGNGKVTFTGANKLAGTYSYKITVEKIARVVNVTVSTPTNNTATSWQLDLSSNAVDIATAAEKVKKDVTIAVYGYSDNGVKVSKETLNGVAFNVAVDAPEVSGVASKDVANCNGTYTFVATPASGAAIAKNPTGSYKVTATRLVNGTWVPVAEQYIQVTDTQVAPVIGEVKARLHTTTISTYAATDANLIAAVKECYKITLNGDDVSANIVAVEANGSNSTTYITNVTIRKYFKIDDTSAAEAYLDQKVTIGDYITKK